MLSAVALYKNSKTSSLMYIQCIYSLCMRCLLNVLAVIEWTITARQSNVHTGTECLNAFGPSSTEIV